MKRTVLFISFITTVTTLSAQSLEEGRSYLDNARYSSAESVFHAVLNQQPENAEAWCLLTNTYLKQELTEEAADTLALAPASVQKEPYFLVAYGGLLLNTNKTDSAKWYFEQAMNLTKSKNADILAAIAEAHINAEKGSPDYALQILDIAQKRDKKNADLLVLEGNAYRRLHKGSEAYQAYQEALNKDKNSSQAYYQLGRIFLSQKNSEMYLDFFNKSITADNSFAPAYYALYNHYLYIDPAKAMEYFTQYKSRADKTPQDDYDQTDLLYLTKQYEPAIQLARNLISRDGDKVQSRLYKLIAYSYEEMKDTATAMGFMQQYFQNEVDSNIILKDYENMATLFTATGKPDSAMTYLEKGLGLVKDEEGLYAHYQTLSRLAKQVNDNAAEAKWLGKFYAGNNKATNVHLFNWGLACYKAGQYPQADSVFGLYAEKYPEQKTYGYYWQARSNAAIDTAMAEGLAIPHYQQLVQAIDSVATPSASDKKWLIEAYNYMAAYETNTKKDYPAAIEYFKKILVVDPANETAQKYITMLEKMTTSTSGK
ncbi:MAG: tetratricopeptide repeat protein [Chitinophagaceae bacterium]|jgi:tetratricopeptide (TPR) repeat protein|nr:MAG: tetratricopeptide repeat protein [Chitinophagaceae bacterium]